jgi:hypothetical protein
MYNVCYTLALYGLMLFWIGAAELLQVRKKWPSYL